MTKRGEIWTVSGAPGYGSKPRPALILQSDVLADTESVITCGFTAQPDAERHFRPLVEASPENGLDCASHVMTEKLTAIPRSKLGTRVGVLDDADMDAVQTALQLVLGLAG
ncbi:MAG: type II toxin-antitoxin system PemK/MazF family toxin [Novosphingobium sp.]